MNQIEERFWAKVDKRGPDECWGWKAGKTTGGYGMIRLNGRIPSYAHRIALQFATGKLGVALMACHTCDNPPCCNPGHLFWGSQKDNIGDAHAKGRTFIMPRQTHCKHGHEMIPENTKIDRDRGGWKRTCRRCSNAATERYRQRKKSQ